MARLDFIHEAVKNALIKDGWTITAVLEEEEVSVIVVSIEKQEILLWINQPNTKS